MLKSWYRIFKATLRYHWHNDIVSPYYDIRLSILKFITGEKVTLKTCEFCGFLNCTCETLEEFEAGFASYLARVNQELIKYDFPEDREAEFEAKHTEFLKALVEFRYYGTEPKVLVEELAKDFKGTLKPEYQ